MSPGRGVRRSLRGRRAEGVAGGKHLCYSSPSWEMVLKEFKYLLREILDLLLYHMVCRNPIRPGTGSPATKIRAYLFIEIIKMDFNTKPRQRPKLNHLLYVRERSDLLVFFLSLRETD